MTDQYAIAEQAGQLVLANRITNDLRGVINSVTHHDYKAFWVAMEAVVESLLAAGVDREQLLSVLMAKEVPEELIAQRSYAHRAI